MKLYLLLMFFVAASTPTETNNSKNSDPNLERLQLSKFAKSQTGKDVQSMTASLTVDRNGPVLLSDTNLVENLVHFNRERIPERVVHAKGGGAFGEFEVTHDITKYTKAAIFSSIGKKTKMFVRFSTVSGELGAADVPVDPPDPRGFALKFYTEHGIWDLTGNNLVVFPIRDPMLFPSINRSRKKNPRTHWADPTAYWDFTSLRPETTLHTMQLYSDLGYPDGFRHMDGAGVHTFKLVNDAGKAVYCKFHYLSQQSRGKNVTYEKGLKLSPDYSVKDLYEAIARKEFPSWKFFIQVMTFKQALESPFNPFDITKLWPKDKYPYIPVGKFVLNKNPVNFFSQVEMAAFSPGNLVPGIEASPDRMFEARAFAYRDTQTYRLGVNFLQIDVNRPFGKKLPKSYDRDGLCFVSSGNSRTPSYFPNSFGGPEVNPKVADSKYFVSGDVERKDIGDEDNFSQATQFYNELPEAEKGRLAKNLARGIKPVSSSIRKRNLKNFLAVSKNLAKDVLRALKSV